MGLSGSTAKQTETENEWGDSYSEKEEGSQAADIKYKTIKMTEERRGLDGEI